MNEIRRAQIRAGEDAVMRRLEGLGLAAVDPKADDESTREEWVDVSESDLPHDFGDACKAFRIVCSNGFVGPLSLESAFLHKPADWPQCFPNGEDGDACCTSRIQRLTAVI